MIILVLRGYIYDIFVFLIMLILICVWNWINRFEDFLGYEFKWEYNWKYVYFYMFSIGIVFC